MKIGKPFDYQDVAGPPPGAGRTFFENSEYAENVALINAYRISASGPIRQLTAERGANTTRRDGDNTGTAFRWRSHRDTLAPFALAALIISVLLYIMAARTFQHMDGWKCRPGERATTNGRDLCPDRGARR